MGLWEDEDTLLDALLYVGSRYIGWRRLHEAVFTVESDCDDQNIINYLH